MGPQRRAVPIVPEGTPLGTHCQLGKYLSITLSSGEFQLLGADGKAPSFFQERFEDDQETQWKPEGGPTSKSSSGDHDGSHGSLEHSGDSATGETGEFGKEWEKKHWEVVKGKDEKDKEQSNAWEKWEKSKGGKWDKSKGKGGKWYPRLPADKCQ